MIQPDLVAERLAEESCDLCGNPLLGDHSHIADLEKYSLLCACRPCFLLFEGREAGGRRFRAVPCRYLRDEAFCPTEAEWDDLDIPVGLVFFMISSSAGGPVAFYPSPAGATQAEIGRDVFDRVGRFTYLAKELVPDLEGLLLHRGDDGQGRQLPGPAEPLALLLPIDVCYEMVGMVRMYWRGFDGGQEMRARFSAMMDDLMARGERGR
jgi:hypothetical protein